MSEESVPSVLENMRSKSTEELLNIWQENDRGEWTEEAFEAAKQSLTERGEVLPPQKEPSRADERKEEFAEQPTVAGMKKDLRGWGFGLTGIGIISIVLSAFLDPIWGGVLIVLGVLALVIQRRGMFIVIGIGLLLAGIMNIAAGEFGGWTVFGFLQLYWGVQEIRKFWKYASLVKE